MKHDSIAALALTLSCALAQGSFAGSLGSSTAQFLKTGLGARPAAMGDAFTGLANDAHAPSWNPAGMIQIGRHEDSFMHNFGFEDSSLEYLSMVHRMSRNKSIGGTLVYQTKGGFDKTDRNGNFRGSFGASDVALGVSYAHRIRKWTSIGVTLKVIRQKIDDVSAQGYALDVGALKRFGRFQLGLVVLNMGTGMQFVNESEALPMTIKAGGAYRFRFPVTMTLDAAMPNDDALIISSGGEWIWRVLAIRWGYKMADNSGSDGFSGITFGLGLKMRNWGLDYAYVAHGTLGDNHKISMVRKIGGTYKKNEKRRAKKDKVKKSRKQRKVDKKALKKKMKRDKEARKAALKARKKGGKGLVPAASNLSKKEAFRRQRRKNFIKGSAGMREKSLKKHKGGKKVLKKSRKSLSKVQKKSIKSQKNVKKSKKQVKSKKSLKKADKRKISSRKSKAKTEKKVVRRQWKEMQRKSSVKSD